MWFWVKLWITSLGNLESVVETGFIFLQMWFLFKTFWRRLWCLLFSVLVLRFGRGSDVSIRKYPEFRNKMECFCFLSSLPSFLPSCPCSLHYSFLYSLPLPFLLSLPFLPRSSLPLPSSAGQLSTLHYRKPQSCCTSPIGSVLWIQVNDG